MEGRKISLRSRIFFSMIVLTIFSLLLILFASYLQYNSQSEDYNLRRLFRKETQVKTHLNYLMKRDTAFQKISQRKAHYKQEFSSIAVIHKVEYALFTLTGQPIFYSYAEMREAEDIYTLSQEVIDELYQESKPSIIKAKSSRKRKISIFL